MKLKLPALHSPYLVAHGSTVRLEDKPTSVAIGNKADSEKALAKHTSKMEALQEKMYASAERSLLIVLQGMDTAGKDGTIRSIFSGINPQGCNVHSFKVPSLLEASHDFLWRVHANAPAKGMIGIFNRSHYEDVLAPRVHGLIDEHIVRQRFDAINNFEEMLTNTGTVVLKFFLHISREEQRERLQARIDDPSKHWKLSEGDFAERKLWPKYVKAYEDLLSNTSAKHAPWFVIPADHKWYRNIAISEIILDAMEQMDLKYPEPTIDVSTLKVSL